MGKYDSDLIPDELCSWPHKHLHYFKASAW